MTTALQTLCMNETAKNHVQCQMLRQYSNGKETTTHTHEVSGNRCGRMSIVRFVNMDDKMTSSNSSHSAIAATNERV